MAEYRSIDSYEKNGFIIVDDLYTKEEIQQLKDETIAIARGERGQINGLEIAGKDESENEIINRYLCFHFPHKMSDHLLSLVSHKKKQ